MELGGGGWSWVEVGARFSNTIANICDWIYFLLKLPLCSEDAYITICLKILCIYVFPFFTLCFLFRRGVA